MPTPSKAPQEVGAKRPAEEEHVKAPSAQYVQLNPESDVGDKREVIQVADEPVQASESVEEDPVRKSRPSARELDCASQATSRSQSKRRTSSKPIDRIPKRDGVAERARTAARKAEREKAAQPAAQIDLSVHSELALPTVSCSNTPVVPSTSRGSEHPVVNGKCINCFLDASSAAHSRVGSKSFDSKEALAFFVRMHTTDEEEQVF